MPKRRRANGEGTIFQRKDGLWAAQYIDNAGERRTLYGKTQQVVKNKLKEAIRESDTGVRMDKNKMTFAEWMAEWLEVYAKPTIKPGTYAAYYNVVHQHIIPGFPKVLLKELRIDMLQKFINGKATGGRVDGKPGGLSTGTLKRIRIALGSALEQAVDNGLVTQNIAKKLKLPPSSKKEIQILTISEQKRLKATAMADTHQSSFCIVLALYTGLRIGELLGLRLEDINLDKKEIYVRRTIKRIAVPNNGSKIVIGTPKTAKGVRTIPLPDFIVEPLTDYLSKRQFMVDSMQEVWDKNNGFAGDYDFLFLSINGSPAEQSTINALFSHILKKAGVKTINFHALRHTFATRCLESGFDVRSLADILGHADAKTTLNTYAHALPDQKRNNMNKLSVIYDKE